MISLFNRRILSLGILLAAAGLSGCDTLRDTFGLNQQAPDEFTVVDGAPLSVPPDFALRPPQADAPPRAQQTPADQRAAETLFGTEGMRSMPEYGGLQAPSAGEQALLAQMKAVPPTSDIRAQIDRESGDHVTSSPDMIHKLLFWQNNRPNQPPATVVNDDAEKARIAADKAAGKPITAGNTPVITRGQPGFFDNWF